MADMVLTSYDKGGYSHKNVVFHLNHSQSSSLRTPYSSDSPRKPFFANFSQWFTIFVHFTGSSDDWVKGVAGIKYAYTIELPDTGSHGFILPAEEIKPIGQEMWAAVKVMAQKLITS